MENPGLTPDGSFRGTPDERSPPTLSGWLGTQRIGAGPPQSGVCAPRAPGGVPVELGSRGRRSHQIPALMAVSSPASSCGVPNITWPGRCNPTGPDHGRDGT